ncbi:MAG: FtsX-like permease family protein, partial [Actinomycetota bacterium]
ARVGARISTLDALASRMPTPRPPGRLARGGLVLVVIGTLLTGVLFTPGDNEVVLTAGLGLMLIGFLISIPWLVTMAGRLAPRLPTASRLAIRDTARHGRRTGTAIAAAALALTTPVAVTAVSLSEESHQRRNRWIGEDHMLIGNQLSDLAGRPERLPAELRTEISQALPDAIVVELRGAMLDLQRHPPAPSEKPIAGGGITEYPAWAEGPQIPLEAAGEETVVKITDDGAESTITTPSSFRRFGQVMIGDAETLRALHAEDGIPALEARKIVGIGPSTTENGFVRILLLSYDREAPRLEVPAVEAGTSSYSGDLMPLYVVSEEGAEAIGLLPGPPAYHNALVAAPGPLTGEDIRAVKDVVARYEGAFVQTLDDFLPNHTVLRLAATAGAMVVALAIVAVVLALIGAEARRDQAILSAIGAGSRARRRIGASRAGLVALLAAAVAVPAGFAPVAVVQWSRPEGHPILVPWVTISLVLVAVPAVAAAFGWLTSRKPSSSAMLQPVA